jgi:hypothetical protein
VTINMNTNSRSERVQTRNQSVGHYDNHWELTTGPFLSGRMAVSQEIARQFKFWIQRRAHGHWSGGIGVVVAKKIQHIHVGLAQD